MYSISYLGCLVDRQYYLLLDEYIYKCYACVSLKNKQGSVGRNMIQLIIFFLENYFFIVIFKRFHNFCQNKNERMTTAQNI